MRPTARSPAPRPARSSVPPSLIALIDEIAPPGWRWSPSWWALIAAVGVAERTGAATPAYVASDAEPHADTMMGTPAADPTPTAAARIGWAIAAAHALADALTLRDGTLPDQPLRARIARSAGAATRVPLAPPWRFGFALGEHLMVATLDPRGPGFESTLARRLAAVATGRPDPDVGRALDEVLAVVAIGDDDLGRVHHAHRRAWTQRGGPWLGLARAGGLDVLSTCHLVVDGWGHALLAGDLARCIDRDALRALAATAAGALGDASAPNLRPLPPEAGDRLGIAWRRGPGPPRRFATHAWALGRVLHRDHGIATAARSPTFQIPIAPGSPDDPDRFARRVRPAVLSVRFSDGRPEPLAEFAARAGAVVAREAAGDGLMARLLAALAAAPLPLGFKRRSIVGARAAWLREPVEALAGAGCLSQLRPPGSPPLIAASSPAIRLPADAARATSVLTVIADGEGTTATLAGSGRACAPDVAAELLEAWLELVAAIPR